jgi:GT2 family glycosyltransferase
MKKAKPSTLKVGVVIPSWNGADSLGPCLKSLQQQSLSAHIILVDNGSTDNSVALVTEKYPDVEIVQHQTNLGYAGGVNPGFRLAIERGYDYIAPFNNDAIADKDWLRHLVDFLDKNPTYGIAACKLLSRDGDRLDSSGEDYTTWGLPYPRGRDETDTDAYDKQTEIFGASGGASLYRVAMLREVGLLDEDFFAYYEDVDLSFRAQLAGWQVVYIPESRVYHATSTTGRRIKGFFTEQTMKNLPMLLWKNVPRAFLPAILPRFALAYFTFFASATQRGQLGYALRGFWRAFTLWPKKHGERRAIQGGRKVSDAYVSSMLTYDLPPNAAKLRRLRTVWYKLSGKHKS